MRKLIILLFLLVFSSSSYATTIYRWVDKKGVLNFTDDYNRVPPEYRDRLEKNVFEEIPQIETHLLPQSSLQETEGRMVDIYGRDKTWWQDKVRSLKDRINGVTANYESIQKKLVEKEGELSRIKYGSEGQIRVVIREMDRLREEMTGYEVQIAEAKEMLKKLSKEAEESRANPDWLK